MARRAEVLAAEPLCRICAAKGIIEAAVVVDHIVPIAQGGDDGMTSLLNLQPLCTACHDAKSASEGVAVPRAVVATGADGWPEV